MAISFTDRLAHAWNAFTSRDPTEYLGTYQWDSYMPSTKRGLFVSDRSILTMIKNRIAVDAAQLSFKHVRKDDMGNYAEDIDSYLNKVLTTSANIDQTGRAFIQDLIMTMLDEGVGVAVPIETTVSPLESGGYDIKSMRVGRVVAWYPKHVRLSVYDEEAGERREKVFPKSIVAIVENPFYSIMNEPNSVLQRLNKTLRNLDAFNDDNCSGKLNLIVSLPVPLSSLLKRQQAESRMQQMESQLTHSKYGIAYTDATEHVTQLNRPLENNLWKEAQDLTAMLFNQMGLTQSIFDGTANEKALTNYYHRTIEPIVAAITEEMERKFLTTTARSQKQGIVYINDPFSLTSVTEIASMAQTLSANEIMTSNELRSKLGLPPVDSERANNLLNKQINKISDTPADEDETLEQLQNTEESNNEQ